MADQLTYTQLRNKILKRDLAPIYLIHGEEGYYIDELVKLFENVLPPEERDFNQYIMYAPRVEGASVADTCRRYPMMSEFQMVILKEAQTADAKFLKPLIAYTENPSNTTVLVIAGRGDKIKSTELIKNVNAAKGVVFESKKLNENRVGPVIAEFIKEKGLNVDPKALAMLQEYVGSDLSRIYNEVDKLTVVLGPGAMVTPESIERNIGVSKDYNNFELVGALARKDATKAFRIVEYFKSNPKNNPTILTASVLFNFYSNLLIAAYAKDKSEHGLLEQLGFKWPRQLTDINAGLRCYNAWQMIAAIDAIRSFDAGSKGTGSRANPFDLLHNLVFTLLYTTGR